MELVYPSKNEIMDFFKTRSGFIKVMRICELMLASKHNNVQEAEITHIKGFLHQLKSQGFLLIENEGQDIYHEGFSTTPDRVEKYFAKPEDIYHGDLTKKTDHELEEIMRNSIDNSYVSGSIYNKAKQELDFRDRNKKSASKETKEEVLKLTPEFYGVGINLKALWHRIKSMFS